MRHGVIAFITLLAGFTAQAGEAVEIKRAYFEFYQFLDGGRHPLIVPPEKLNSRLSLRLELDLFKYLYWNSTVHGTASHSQFRTIGLMSEIGVRPFWFLELGFHHHSQHELDQAWPYYRFPVEDGFIVRVNFKRSPASP